MPPRHAAALCSIISRRAPRMGDAPGARVARAALWSGIGVLSAAVGALTTFFCCVPIVAGAAGGLAALSSFAWVARPWLLAGAGVVLAVGFWYAYRPEPCAEGRACAQPASRRRA